MAAILSRGDELTQIYVFLPWLLTAIIIVIVVLMNTTCGLIPISALCIFGWKSIYSIDILELNSAHLAKCPVEHFVNVG